MGAKSLLIDVNRTQGLSALLVTYKKEHFSRSDKKIKGTREYFSVWELGQTPNSLLLKLESAKYGYVDAMVDVGTGLITIYSHSKNVGASRADVAKEVKTSFTGAFAKLRDKAAGKGSGGGGNKKGFYLKHGIGVMSAYRTRQALKRGLISVNFQNDLKRLDVGMCFYK